MVLSTFIICAMLCLTNCSNDDAPTSVFTPEALKQTTWQAQMTVYNIEDEIDYTKQSILQFTNESEGIYTRTNEEDGYMWNTDFTCQVLMQSFLFFYDKFIQHFSVSIHYLYLHLCGRGINT